MMLRLLIAVSLTLVASVAQAIEITEFESPKGAEIWLVEDHGLPFVSLDLMFEGGAVLDREGKRGAANLMTALIEEGAGDMDARSFQARREALAADFGFRVSSDWLNVSARMLTENRDEAADLLHLALTEPRFDEDAINRVRGQVLAGLAADAKSPNALAQRAFWSALYGSSAYGTAQDGTEESVSALTQQDLRQSHADLLTHRRVLVSAVGDITPQELGALVDALLEGVPETGPALPPQAEVTLDPGAHVVPFETPQSVAVFGHTGIARTDPDFIAAYVLNEMLGGRGQQSLLMEEVREKRGLTYGITTWLSNTRGGAVVMGSFASANDRMAEALDVVRSEWHKAAMGRITEERLEAVKTYLIGAYPLRFDGNDQIASILSGMQIWDLPASYVDDRNALIEAVTLADVKRVAERLLAPEDLMIYVAGQPEGLE